MQEETSRHPIGVMIVEDDAVTRKALSLAIESEPKLRLLAALESVKAALTWLEVNVPEVLMTDLGLPDGSGLEVIHACTSRHPQTDIMVVTMSSDEANVLACIEAGASGYVLKDAGKTDIARAVLDLRSGGAPMSPAIARMVLAKVRGGNKPVVAREQDPATSLTKRESAILDLIARGDSYGEVAKLLSVSVGTVQTHIKNIYGKLAVHSRGEAVFEAHRRGLLQIGQPRVHK
ncbi:response regulator transcription factor [Noviherbaspirillum sp. CPCC 100848]|uniref:Response regulator transcription factor n=1 Tax=Noviherbaspirillum album TaxID=3080276 RepID=A0ABU6JD56_9BURK|nr:response regulator transcription factor [Noviherbaspirillum sp. CPCC 100848]MEC4721485.1 response regulator transcription factor [Noviherbaspirillum sp. CPCC 100848]